MMGEQLEVGDRVKLEIEGTIESYAPLFAGTHKIRADSGSYHYVFLGGRNPKVTGALSDYGVRVIGSAVSGYVAGKAYQDAAGNVFIRSGDDMWVDCDGDIYSDYSPVRPLTLLVPEK
jgi:hypothetical protein